MLPILYEATLDPRALAHIALEGTSWELEAVASS